MPYKVYKKGSGYKACKKGGKKCFSKKPLTKEKAVAQTRAIYASKKANESLEPNSDSLEFFKVWKYPKANEYHVWFKLSSGKDVLTNIVYTAGESMDEVDYIETRITDPGIPAIQIFEDPQSEEAKEILNQYGLTEDDIENAGQEGYRAIERVKPKKETLKDSLHFENTFREIVFGEKKEIK